MPAAAPPAAPNKPPATVPPAANPDPTVESRSVPGLRPLSPKKYLSASLSPKAASLPKSKTDLAELPTTPAAKTPPH
jgi:hypothetical protein